MTTKKLVKANILLFLLTPFLATAQSNFSSLDNALDSIVSIMTRLVALVIGLAVLFFIWAVFRYVGSGGDEKERAEARGLVVWGIVAIFVMVSVWGLVRILDSTFNLTNDALPAPQLFPPTE